MEDQFFLSLSFILPILVTVILFYILKSKSQKDLNLPPGSYGWPIIGETLGFMNEPHDKWIGDRMKKYSSKIFKTKLLGEPVVFLCGTAGHKFIASNELQMFLAWRPKSQQKIYRTSAEAESATPIPRQTETQIVRAPNFLKPDALVQYVGTMDTLVQEHLDRYWVGKQIVDAHKLSLHLLLTLACRFLMGYQDHARIEKLSDYMNTVMFALDVIPLKIPGTCFYKGLKAAESVRKEIRVLIKEKKAAMASGVEMQDIFSFMISRPDPSTGKFTPEDDIADKMMGLLSAAFNSPCINITFIMKFLAERPEILQKVRDEQFEVAKSKNPGEPLNWADIQKMKYSWNVALEVMRHRPPVQGFFREATTDFTYEGYTIPKGWKVCWSVSSTNMDPELFPEPEVFDPTRFDRGAPPPYSNVPFGSGPRSCPGKDYARMQILTFLHHVVRRFNWDLINPDCKVLGGMNPIPIDGLPIRLHKY
ncbi:beta-amyrin 28-monooxygenase [Ziziphus jujuba]|uniref:Beta-amyrin 28-monooxygenase n=1 Tax=Ziziphus jujuba TaxID=326968 RepID=A0ABM3I0H4_ZIZJJ|nr:beta-amyrin 28-monooxygenase [Ziziphus jujuba]